MNKFTCIRNSGEAIHRLLTETAEAVIHLSGCLTKLRTYLWLHEWRQFINQRDKPKSDEDRN